MVGDHTTPEGRRFATWLESGAGVLVVGGRVTEEICRNGNIVRYLNELRTAGRLRVAETNAVYAEAMRLEQGGGLVSDDAHVLAVARISKASLLFSRDRNLHKDYLNRTLMGFSGRVYQGQQNLLTRDVCR
jgi:hypothetical protein